MEPLPTSHPRYPDIATWPAPEPAAPVVPILPDWAMARAAISVPEAGALLGISRDSAYAAAHAGDIPTIRAGRRLLVPVARLAALLAGETAA